MSFCFSLVWWKISQAYDRASVIFRLMLQYSNHYFTAAEPPGRPVLTLKDRLALGRYKSEHKQAEVQSIPRRKLYCSRSTKQQRLVGAIGWRLGQCHCFMNVLESVTLGSTYNLPCCRRFYGCRIAAVIAALAMYGSAHRLLDNFEIATEWVEPCVFICIWSKGENCSYLRA